MTPNRNIKWTFVPVILVHSVLKDSINIFRGAIEAIDSTATGLVRLCHGDERVCVDASCFPNKMA